MIDLPREELEAVLGAAVADEVESLRPRSFGATVGVWRVRAGGRSAVLKLLRHGAGSGRNWASSDDPSHPRWWRREHEALSSGVLDALAPELRAPRLLLASDRPDGSLALWLEDLGAPSAWTVDAIAAVALLLGAAQRRARPVPPTGFLRAYLEPRLPHLAEPYASRRDEIHTRLDAAPQTLSHFDLHPANVFFKDGATVVIDWAYCGTGPVGADAGVLAADAIFDEFVPVADVPKLVAAVWDAYCEGAGGVATEEVFALATALRYAWLPAWIAGDFGEPPSAQRARAVAAGYELFCALAAPHLGV